MTNSFPESQLEHLAKCMYSLQLRLMADSHGFPMLCDALVRPVITSDRFAIASTGRSAR